jgi:hypothetical protein
MRALALLLLSLMVAVPARSQSGYDEFMRDDLDPYGGLRGGNQYGTGAGPANPYTAYPGAGAAAGPAQPGFTQNGAVQQGQPWSGVWWPRKPCELAFMPFSMGLSPMEKYDTLVYSHYGQNPGAAAWEADPQNGHNEASRSSVDWSGHCNGLAAAAILEPEPRGPIQVPLGRYGALQKLVYQGAASVPAGIFRDGRNDYQQYQARSNVVELTVADQKGWLCEMYMNVYTQQFENRDITGVRYDNPNPDLRDSRYRDIHPHYFHYLLQAFVKNRGQAIVVEVDPGFPVNNHPLFRFDSTSQYYPQQRKYSVQTTVYMADYGRGYNEVGTNVNRQTFTYDLLLDQYGRIYWGEWTGASQYNHPDFVWIPTGLAPNNNGYSNPALNHQFAKYLMNRR